MITQLQALRTLIEDAVADATCEVSGVTVTAGRPAAPSGEDCVVVYVFAENMTDFNQTNLIACNVDSRFAMQYEIHGCYPEDWEDQIGTDDAEAAAACLYELMQLVWCALVEAKDIGYFCDCQDMVLEPLEVQPRSGQAVSALGGVTLPYACPAPEESSPSSP